MASRGPRFTEAELREAVAASLNWKETLRRLGYCPTGGNPATVKKYVELWGVDASHFDPDAARHRGLRAGPIPLEKVLVRHSTYSRGNLKRRLYDEGVKQRACELCGQGEQWRGAHMALILDHINGRRDDNRLENLRIVCPNCAATLPTHCGRGLRKPPRERNCDGCGRLFVCKYRDQRFCSRECGQRFGRMAGAPGVPRPATRKVERPPYKRLMREIEQTSYLAVGRKYGVSDNAIRKWVAFYERQRARSDGDGG